MTKKYKKTIKKEANMDSDSQPTQTGHSGVNEHETPVSVHGPKHSLKDQRRGFSKKKALIFAAIFAVLGIITLFFTQAAPVPFEAENMTVVPTTSTASTSVTLKPSDDSWGSSSNTSTNYGSKSTIRDVGPSSVSYMKYDLTGTAGKTITQAKLRMKVANSSAGTQNFKQVSDTTWKESTLTYSNKPAVGSLISSLSGGAAVGSWVEVDVTSYVKAKSGQLMSLAIDTTSGDGFEVYSEESVDDPQLIISYGSTSAGTTYPAAVVTDSLASGGKALKYNTNGNAYIQTANVTDARTVVITAKGEQCNGAPNLVAKVNGVQVMSASVAATSFSPYTISLSSSVVNPRLDIAFTNDTSTATCDSSLIVDKIEFSEAGSIPDQTNCSDGLDNDNDGKIDYPSDPGCSSSSDTDETDTPVSIGDPAPNCIGEPADYPQVTYPEKRVFLEAQGWWAERNADGTIQKFGAAEHIHVGACMPLQQTVSGSMRLDVRVVGHNLEPGSVITHARFHDANGTTYVDIPLNRTVSAGETNIVMTKTINWDSKAAQDGLRELRFLTFVERPNAAQLHASTGWCVNFANGNSKSDQESCGRKITEGRGWYECFEYKIGRAENWTYPYDGIPAGQNYVIPVAGKDGAGEDTQVTRNWLRFDPNFHAGNLGTLIFERSGASNVTSTTIPGSLLTPGTHFLFMMVEADGQCSVSPPSQSGQVSGGIRIPLLVK